jgi:hypothetical protein
MSPFLGSGPLGGGRRFLGLNQRRLRRRKERQRERERELAAKAEPPVEAPPDPTKADKEKPITDEKT